MPSFLPIFRPLRQILPCVLAALLGACVSSSPAPVETRDTSSNRATATTAGSVASAASSSAGPAVARPGYYIVKKGDTLYSIALENGHSYRDVASWNNIDNPALISVGQELRVQPPDAPAAIASGTRPVILPRIESRPVDQSAPALVQSAPVTSSNASSSLATSGNTMNAGGIVTEPHGGRIPYSEKAWKDLLAQTQTPGQSEPKAASAPVADMRSVTKSPIATTSAPVATPQASADTTVRTGDEGVEWSWPSNGKLIGIFNDRSNKGVDIGGAIGDPVFAAASGKVIYVGSGVPGLGKFVIIQHAGQYTSVYAYNKEILVKENQQVQKGQKIAVMGDSDSDKPKLHFEVRKQGKPADPLKFLPTR